MDPRVNTREWWDAYFEKGWKLNRGSQQTAAFMKSLIGHLPHSERDYLKTGEPRIADWGCAFGEGVSALARSFPKAEVVGVDFSSQAIERARRKYKTRSFLVSKGSELPEDFDVVITSNCLEHFHDPLAVIRGHLSRCSMLYIALVPYNEYPLHEHHFSQFREESFPEQLEGFRRIACRVIEVDSVAWDSDQILVIYASPGYVSERLAGASPLPSSAESSAVESVQSHEGLQSDGVGEVEALKATNASIRRELTLRERDLADRSARAATLQIRLEEAVSRGLELSHELSHKERDIADSKRVIDEIALRIREIEPRLAVREVEVVEQASALSSRERDVSELRTANERATANAEMLEAQLEDSATELIRFGRALEEERSSKHELERRAEGVSATLDGVRERRAELELTLAELRAGKAAVDQHAERLSSELSELQAGKAEVDQRAERLSSELSGLRLAVEEVDRRAANLSAELGELRAHKVEVDQRAADLASQLGEVRSSKADVERNVEGLTLGLRELQAAKTEVDQHAEHLSGELARSNQRVVEKAGEAHAIYLTLQGIYESTSWALIRPLVRLRHAVAPAGSKRERFGQRLMHAQRRFVYRTGRLFRRAPRKVEAATVDPSSSGDTDIPARDPESPLVSVILPVYNQADWLGDSIDSVLAQDYPSWELIVLDDGSTDGVAEVLAHYQRDPRVRILSQENQRLPKALSNAFELASGEYWTWTSADNIMEPRHLSVLVDYLERNPSTAMVYANYLAIDDRGEPLASEAFRPHNRKQPDSPEIYLSHDTSALGAVKDNFIGACFLYRASVGRLVGEYDPQLGVEDYDYWMRIRQHFPIEHVDSEEMLYRYRVHDNSLNARAVDFGIFEAADRLMEYEADRAREGARPWTVAVDSGVRAMLGDTPTAPHDVVEWPPSAALESVEEPSRRLLILAADSLGQLGELSDAELAAYDCVIAWMGDDLDVIYQQRRAIGQRVDACLVPSRREASRVALFNDRFLVVRSPEERLAWSLAFAKNHSYFRATRSEAELARRPAELFTASGRPTRLVLQIDVFAHGGMEQVLLDQAVCLRELGFAPLLVTIERAGPVVYEARSRNLEVVDLSGVASAERSAAYGALLAEREIDLVVSHLSLFGTDEAAARGIPFVQIIHNTYVWFGDPETAAYRAAEPATRAYLCVSAEAARYADRCLGLPSDKLIVLHNGVDTAHFEPLGDTTERRRLREKLELPGDAFVFLNVASIYEPKAQHEMVSALERVLTRHPDALLVFAGQAFDKAFEDRVRKQVKRAGLGGSVVFAGLRADILDYYHAADAFLLPSFWEGCSIALMEAALCGLPIIASRVGSAEDQFAAVPGVTLVDPPFGSITDLNAANLRDVIQGGDEAFIARLAAAMTAVCADPHPVALSAGERVRLDRAVAYSQHARLLHWIAQGGEVPGARRWLRATALADAIAEKGKIPAA